MNLILREFVEALIYSPVYALGATETHEKVTVVFFEDFIEDHQHPIAKANIEIKSR